jgi:glycosyltransferase involved in cell wall biosynthesis
VNVHEILDIANSGGFYKMNENAIVSIIIPVYNCEKMIVSTLRSIKQQTYKFLEILVVNDGSTDSTAEIVATHIKEDARIQLITIENSGPANARNAGLQKAQGDYVMFVDGDDVIEKNAVERALQAAYKSNCDLVIFGYSIIYKDKELIHYGLDTEIGSSEQLGEWLSKLYVHNLLNQIWNKLYRREVLRQAGLRFPNFRYGEDRLFVFSFLQQTNRICVIKDSLYRYHQNPGTLVTCFYSEKFDVCCLIDQALLDISIKTGANKPQDVNAFNFMFLKSVISCLVNLYAPACKYSTKAKYDCMRQILENPRVVQALEKTSMVWGVPFWLLTRVMKTRNIALNHITFFISAWASRNLTRLFLHSRKTAPLWNRNKP